MAVELKNLKPPVLAGFGNPLLDICVILKDASFYEKYNLKSDGQKEITSSELLSLYNDFKKENYEFQYCAGGCAQNTLRVFQWIIKIPYYSVLFGGVGNDEQGNILRNKLENDGVITKYAQVDGHSTGTCIAIINGAERSLVAHLGAANIYTVSDFFTAENIELFTKIQIVYVEAFFITHSFATAKEVVKLCSSNGVAIVFNISGVYVIENHYEEILYMMNSSDIVIGNCNEYREFWKYYNIDKRQFNLKDVLMQLQIGLKTNIEKSAVVRLPLFSKEKVGKIVICTQGSEAVYCVFGSNELITVEPENIDQHCIKDTTGAGDSFVGGFLAGILRNSKLFESIKLGCWAAGQIIQQIGCSLPN